MATANDAAGDKAVPSFEVLCPFCGAEGVGNLTVDLNELRGVHCSACGVVFTPARAARKVAEQLRRWQAIGRWLALAGAALADPPGEEEAV